MIELDAHDKFFSLDHPPSTHAISFRSLTMGGDPMETLNRSFKETIKCKISLKNLKKTTVSQSTCTKRALLGKLLFRFLGTSTVVMQTTL